MRLLTTTPERTYRYVRIAIVGAVVALFVALGVTVASVGPIGSFSALYYTPGRDVFVGMLLAVALALVALSGRSVQQVLLDYAAIAVPVIAIVPTPVITGEVPGPLPCEGPDPCVPASAVPAIDVGMATFAAIGFFGLLAAVVVSVVQRTLTVRVGAAVAGGAILVAAFVAWWVVHGPSFVAYGHFAAASVFFGLIGAVAGVAAWGSHPERAPGRSLRECAWYRAIYVVVATGILVSLAFLVAVVVGRRESEAWRSTDVPLVLVGEAALLVLFAAFWVTQTAQSWDGRDPSRSALAPTT